MVVDFAIGNQWQWDNFTIGTDWIGYMQPLSDLSSTEYEAGNDDDLEFFDSSKEWERLSEDGAGEALRFYLGSSF